MLYKRWKGRLLLFLAVFFAAVLFFSQAAAAGRIKDKVLRLHVIANSDSEEDQALKLKVRDQVLATLKPLLENAEDRSSSEAIVRGSFVRGRGGGRETAWQEKPGKRACGAYQHPASRRRPTATALFPQETMTPYGSRSARRKEKTGGACFFRVSVLWTRSTASCPEESKELLKNVLTEEEYESLFTPGKSEYKVRWKAAEIWQSLFG